MCLLPDTKTTTIATENHDNSQDNSQDNKKVAMTTMTTTTGLQEGGYSTRHLCLKEAMSLSKRKCCLAKEPWRPRPRRTMKVEAATASTAGIAAWTSREVTEAGTGVETATASTGLAGTVTQTESTAGGEEVATATASTAGIGELASTARVDVTRSDRGRDRRRDRDRVDWASRDNSRG